MLLLLVNFSVGTTTVPYPCQEVNGMNDSAIIPKENIQVSAEPKDEAAEKIYDLLKESLRCSEIFSYKFVFNVILH